VVAAHRVNGDTHTRIWTRVVAAQDAYVQLGLSSE